MIKINNKTTSAGFEPARAKPNRFQVYLLNHSDTMSVDFITTTYSMSNIFLNNLNVEYTIRYQSLIQRYKQYNIVITIPIMIAGAKLGSS